MTTSICSTDHCSRRVKGRGLCELHYDRAKAAGTLHLHKTKKVPPGADLDQRLHYRGWDVVDRQRPGAEGPCWEFRGGRNAGGYGMLAVGKYRDGSSKRSVPMLAPRAAYTAWVGEIPEGMVVRHRCDNPPCINPIHLVLGTHGDNSEDAVGRQRTATWNRRPHKLTDAEVEQIRSRYMSGGITQRALAEDYDVCQQLVSHLVRRTRRIRPTHPPLT